MNKVFWSLVFGLWSLVMGCGQQPKAQNTARNEVVVASTPITEPTAPAELLPKPTELTQLKRSWVGTPMERIARNKAMQLALKNANFYSGEIDGKIGPKTKEAVRKFQMSKNLTADGIVGDKTWAELKAYLPQEQTNQEKE
jgi:peptidoglycan hydrolase-like protein with peptidoglycan-binding domain